MNHFPIPFEQVLDYSGCLITMEETSKTGGFRFLQHKNLVGVQCSPVYVYQLTDIINY